MLSGKIVLWSAILFKCGNGAKTENNYFIQSFMPPIEELSLSSSLDMEVINNKLYKKIKFPLQWLFFLWMVNFYGNIWIPWDSNILLFWWVCGLLSRRVRLNTHSYEMKLLQLLFITHGCNSCKKKSKEG